MKTTKKFFCNVCSTNFQTFYTLRRHCQRKHAGQINSIAPLPKKIFHCSECMKGYNQKKCLYKHERRVHNIQYVKSSRLIECSLCDLKNLRKEEAFLHMSNVHKLDLVPEIMEFSSESDFLNWKGSVEKSGNCKFVGIGGKHKSRETRSQTLVCQRTIVYNSKRTSLRASKSQAQRSRKRTHNTLCPAEIKYSEKNGVYKVTFVRSHAHKMELGRIQLSQQERTTIPKKINQKIPIDKILNEICESVYKGEDISQQLLLTKKDIHDIETSFNLCGTIKRDQNDAINADVWVKQEMQKNESCVLFYKPQNVVLQDFPELKASDFILITMNSAQAEILRKFGSDTICIDGTCNFNQRIRLNQCDFQVITLIILDELKQGFPCAFLFSNRTDESVLKMFFLKIKDIVGTVCPENFMSDITEEFYNAFIAVMQPPKRRLFCTWIVDKAWQKKLSEIPSKAKQIQVYKLLRIVLEESDINTFERIITEIVNYLLTNEETKEFGIYFNNYYMSNVGSWAFCYRLHSGIDNEHLERIHQTIKYIYCNNRRVKQLDKLLYILQKFVRDYLYNRLSLHLFNITTKLTDLRKTHLSSLKLDSSSIIDHNNGWMVCSSSNSGMCFIEWSKLFDTCNCQLKCLECTFCIHNFNCTCTDNAIHWNMCEHIHLLCRSIFSSSSEKKRFQSLEDMPIETIVIINEDFDDEENTLKEERENLGRWFRVLLNTANGHQLHYIKKQLLALETTIAAMKESHNKS